MLRNLFTWHKKMTVVWFQSNINVIFITAKIDCCQDRINVLKKASKMAKH
jgi:hypothetical protein